jgi:hypothetical protein
MREDYRIGDPVMDAAQGRAMIVVSDPTETVAEWSERENYSLTENYANGKFDPDPDEPAVECVYVSDVRSEPSKTYTFPASRLRLIDVHHADDGRRIAERAVLGVLEQLFDLAMTLDAEWAVEPDDFEHALRILLTNHSDRLQEIGEEAHELADVSHTIGDDADADADATATEEVSD